MNRVVLTCPDCRRVIGDLLYAGAGFDLTLSCPACHNGPQFCSGRTPQADRVSRTGTDASRVTDPTGDER